MNVIVKQINWNCKGYIYYLKMASLSWLHKSMILYVTKAIIWNWKPAFGLKMYRFVINRFIYSWTMNTTNSDEIKQQRWQNSNTSFVA